MKALNKIWMAALAAVAMTACNNELSEQALNNGGNVNFTMGIGNTPSSRVSMPETGYTASFAANDEVGIFVAEVPSYTNVKYSTADGTAWTGGPIKVSADAVYTYYAYYPYAADMAANNIPVVVATNQDTEGYIKNDFLYKKYVASQGQTDVKLTFDHALSLVEVTLAGSGAAEGATVDLLNVATDATIDLTSDTPVTTGTTTATVTMDALSNLKYRAIVPAQDIAASTPIFKIAVNGRTYQAKYSGVMKFEQGKYLAMTITLGEQGGDAEIEITDSASINDWTEGTSNGGDASISVAELNIPLPTDGNVLETIALNWSASTAANQIGSDKKEGWYKRSGSSVTNLTVVGYDESEGAMTIKRFVDSDGAWNSDNITYHSCTPLEIGQYELSFDLKGATVEGNVDNKDNPIYGTVGVGISVSGDSALFRIPILASLKDETDPDKMDYGRTLTTKAATSEFVTVTTKFNFGEISTQTKSSGLLKEDFTTATAENVNKGVNIIFYSNKVTITNPSILYIRNIKLTKVEE